MKYAKWIVVIVVVTSVSYGCRNRDRLNDPAPEGSVVIAVQGFPHSLNPYLDDTGMSVSFYAQLFPTLLVEDPNYEKGVPTFSPNLAASYEVSEDHRTVTFHLQPNAHWNNGTPVTADDVRCSFDAQTSPELAWVYGDVKEGLQMMILDSKTVQFVSSVVDPFIVMNINDGNIIPASWCEEPLEDWENIDWHQRTDSSGPFMVTKFTAGQELVMEANQGYWDWPEKPYLDRVYFRKYAPESDNSVTVALQAGDISMTPHVTPHDVKRLMLEPHLRLVTIDSRKQVFIGFNCESELFSDPRVRRAFARCIDKAGIVQSIKQGYGIPMKGPVIPTMWGHNNSLPKHVHAPALTREELVDIGWIDLYRQRKAMDPGFKVRVFAPSSDTARDLATMLPSDMESSIGVQLEFTFRELISFQSALPEGDFDLFLFGFVSSTRHDFEVYQTNYPWNFMRYSNSEVDRLIEASYEAETLEELVPIYHRLQEVIAKDQPVVWLYQEQTVAAVHTSVHNTEINGADPFFNLHEWWTDSCTRKPRVLPEASEQ